MGAGASVAGAGTGIYVANAGGDVTVESGGTIRGGTDGIRVIKPGTTGDITITTTGGSITATAGAGIHPQDNAGHTGTVTVTNAGDITAGTWGILANRLGAGTVSVASSGGTVFGMTEPGIFAANKAGDASDLSVDVTGGTVRSSGRNKAALHAWNRGTGDLEVTLGTGVGAISKHGAGVFAVAGQRVLDHQPGRRHPGRADPGAHGRLRPGGAGDHGRDGDGAGGGGPAADRRDVDGDVLARDGGRRSPRTTTTASRRRASRRCSPSTRRRRR